MTPRHLVWHSRKVWPGQTVLRGHVFSMHLPFGSLAKRNGAVNVTKHAQQSANHVTPSHMVHTPKEHPSQEAFAKTKLDAVNGATTGQQVGMHRPQLPTVLATLGTSRGTQNRTWTKGSFGPGGPTLEWLCVTSFHVKSAKHPAPRLCQGRALGSDKGSKHS